MTQQGSNKRALVWLLAAMFAAVFSGFTVQAQADELAGTWNLDSYLMEGEDVPSAGLMIFTEGHFAMVYAMDYQGRSGRGHGGTYETDGDQITFLIPWWPQHVAGKSEVMQDEVTARARFEVEGNSLALHHEGGAVQRFTRAAGGDASVSQTWLMTDYASRAKTGPASGMLLFSGEHFALLYTMRPANEAPDGRAHAGTYARAGNKLDLTVDWSLQVIGGEGSVADEGSSTRSATVQATDETLSMDLGGGAVQTFRRAR